MADKRISICPVCGMEFEHYSGRRIYCLPKCLMVVKMKRQKTIREEQKKKLGELRMPMNRMEYLDRRQKKNWIKYMNTRREYFAQLSRIEPTEENIVMYADVVFDSINRNGGLYEFQSNVI